MAPVVFRDAEEAIVAYLAGSCSTLDIIATLDDAKAAKDGCPHRACHIFMSCMHLQPPPQTLLRWGIQNLDSIGEWGAQDVVDLIAHGKARMDIVDVAAMMGEPNFVGALFRYATYHVANGLDIPDFVYGAYDKCNADTLYGAFVKKCTNEQEIRRYVSHISCFVYVMRTEAELRKGLVTLDTVPRRVLGQLGIGWNPDDLRKDAQTWNIIWNNGMYDDGAEPPPPRERSPETFV